MPAFVYTVLQHGVRRQGILEAASERDAVEQLRRDGASVLSLTPSPHNILESCRITRFGYLADRLLIRPQSVEQTLRQIGSLLRSGVPILTALNALARTASRPMRNALLRTAQVIRNGKPFSKALAANLPGIDQISIGLLGVGEANGTLDQMATHAAELREWSRKTREQILQAFTYPAFVMCAAMGVGYYMVRKVFPVVMKFIESSRHAAELPLPTRMVIALDSFLTTYGLYILLAPVVLVALVIALRRSSRSGEWVDAVALRIPLFGGVLRFHANTIWCSTLGSLLAGGLDVLTAVDLVRSTMSNWLYAAQFNQIRTQLRDGTSLSQSITSTELHRLTPIAHTLVSVSEEGGQLDESLMEAARFSEDQLKRRVTLLSKMVEPAVFIFVGGFVGLVYFGFFLAVLSATQAAR